jgi:Putative auto-transporter adhesin, head GIN domain
MKPQATARRAILRSLNLATFTALLGLQAATVAIALQPSAAHAATLTEIRPASGFTAVRAEGSMTVNVVRGATDSVQVQGPEAGVREVETVVETRDGAPTLIIRRRSAVGWMDGASARVTVSVQAAELKGVALAGSGDLNAEPGTVGSLRVTLSGSGDVRLSDVQAESLVLAVAGSGDLRATGRTARLKVSVAGSGDAWLRDLSAEDAEVSVAGSGDVRLQANRSLKASVAGSGDVRYTGKATDISSRTAGSGTIRRE